jgi:hypothetical protein
VWRPVMSIIWRSATWSTWISSSTVDATRLSSVCLDARAGAGGVDLTVCMGNFDGAPPSLEGQGWPQSSICAIKSQRWERSGFSNGSVASFQL